jgi:hypothetical protein
VRARPVVLLVGGSAYSLIAASTTAFTLPADVLTGLAILTMAVLVIVRWPLRTRSAAAPSTPPTISPPAGDAAGDAAGAPRRSAHPYLPWLVLLAVFVAWELFNYLVHGTRANHPTFSSITDANDRFYVLKAMLFLGWMAAGWVIVGVGVGRPGRAP